MNWQLFTAFLLITLVLFLIPGPIVTLVIATSASKGTRAPGLLRWREPRAELPYCWP